MSDPAAFVRAQTALVTPPLVPEIRLHLASAVTPLWRATEATLAAREVPPPYWAFAWPGGQAPPAAAWRASLRSWPARPR